MRFFALVLGLVMIGLPAAAPRADPVELYAAGSLKAALGQAAADYEAAYGTPVATTFGPSGLLRERIEEGAPAQVFASANMKHPQALATSGRGGPVVLFARNKLCALTRAGVEATTETLLDALLGPDVRVGTSTPKADPSGDYAWQLFAKADALRPGARATLEAKALQLTGGADSEKAPDGRNQYGWVMEGGKADIFLTYCTNAVLAKADVPSLRIVEVPPALDVGADYGLIVLDGDSPDAWRFALHILSPEGQGVLARYGFEATAVPAE